MHPESVPSHYRWNFTVLSLDIASYSLATSFVSFSTILPAFIEHLTRSEVAIGILAALSTAGYALPNFLFVPITERVRRKKLLILWVTPGERLPYLLLAFVAAFLATTHPYLTIILTFLLLGVFTGTGGALTPAWLDLIARAIPARRRGAFFGRSYALAGATGVVGAFISQVLLAREPFPTAFVHLYLLGFMFVMISYGFFALNREVDPLESRGRESVASWLRVLVPTLKRDRNFSWYLLAMVLASLANSAAGFFTAFALRRLHAPDATVALYTAALLASQTVFNLIWGWLADRHGHKLVLACGIATLGIATVIALLIPTATLFAVVFALLGAGQSAYTLSRLAIVLEFSSHDRRPTYVGLASLALAPLALIGPLAGGAIIDRLGFGVTFTGYAVAGVFALSILVWKVREPRSAAAGHEPAFLVE
ncbi:MAG: MFS transporter [Chloroflexi bacterium]|nr:MFS transporter [Chloroflexota bacterium]